VERWPPKGGKKLSTQSKSVKEGGNEIEEDRLDSKESVHEGQKHRILKISAKKIIREKGRMTRKGTGKRKRCAGKKKKENKITNKGQRTHRKSGGKERIDHTGKQLLLQRASLSVAGR